MTHPIVLQSQLLQGIRDFFLTQKFVEVMCPPMVPNPGMETHIHPFKLQSARQGLSTDYYLQTSPEFFMKKLLSEGLEKIFTLSYSFRDEPSSPIHRPQFIMLEWYRSQSRYEKIMDDVEGLIKFCAERLNQQGINTVLDAKNTKWQRVTVQKLIKAELKFDILEFLEEKDLKEKIKKDFPQVPLPNGELSWDDYFFLLFLNLVEPKLKEIPYLLLYEFPHHLAALSTLKKNDPRVCERFEVYINGIELCNCFNELTDLTEQKIRMQKQNKEKQMLYGYSLPEPEILYQALAKGINTPSGIALGVERLLLALTGENKIFAT